MITTGLHHWEKSFKITASIFPLFPLMGELISRNKSFYNPDHTGPRFQLLLDDSFDWRVPWYGSDSFHPEGHSKSSNSNKFDKIQFCQVDCKSDDLNGQYFDFGDHPILFSRLNVQEKYGLKLFSVNVFHITALVFYSYRINSNFILCPISKLPPNLSISKSRHVISYEIW